MYLRFAMNPPCFLIMGAVCVEELVQKALWRRRFRGWKAGINESIFVSRTLIPYPFKPGITLPLGLGLYELWSFSGKVCMVIYSKIIRSRVN